MAYNVISLEDMYKSMDIDNVKEILNQFECSLNKDVEFFIKEKAIEFLKLGISKTFLVTTSYKEKQVIVGYFALTDKVTKIKKNSLSKTLSRRIKRFSRNENIKNYYIVSLPLIGQLGKNFANNYNELISGDVLLKLACDKVE